MTRLSLVTLILFVSMSSNVHASRGDETAKNAVGLNLLGLVGGGVSGNYEHLFNERDALFIEAGADANSGYSLQAAYLRHSLDDEKKKGLFAPAWGPFIRISRIENEFEDDDLNQKYTLEAKSINIGLMMTHSYALSNRFRLDWRLGYGLPVSTDFSWDDDTFEDRKLMENITKFIIGIEGGVTLSYVF